MRRILGIAVVLICGCSSGEQGAAALSIEQLPAGHLAKAQEKMRSLNHPDIKFQSATLLKNGTYEIRGKDPRGKSWEVEIDKNGNVTLD
jgi:hypothetical protein